MQTPGTKANVRSVNALGGPMGWEQSEPWFISGVEANPYSEVIFLANTVLNDGQGI